MTDQPMFLIEEGHEPAVCPACGEWVTRKYFLLTDHPINKFTGKCFMQMQWEQVPGSSEDYLESKAKGLHWHYTGY